MRPNQHVCQSVAINAVRGRTDAQFLADCRLDTFRGPGPGGQKRNKTSSAVRLTHEPTGLSATAGELRSQLQNRKHALERLRRRIAIELRQPVEIDPLIIPAWFSSLLTHGRLNLSQRQEQYLPAIGFLLDVVAAAGYSVSAAADVLSLSTGNVVELILSDADVRAEVNRCRAMVGLRTLVGK